MERLPKTKKVHPIKVDASYQCNPTLQENNSNNLKADTYDFN